MYYVSPRRWIADHIIRYLVMMIIIIITITIRYLVMLNSSVNFIIYCFVGSKFRETLALFKLCEKLRVSWRRRGGSPASSLSYSLSSRSTVVEAIPLSPKRPSLGSVKFERKPVSDET